MVDKKNEEDILLDEDEYLCKLQMLLSGHVL